MQGTVSDKILALVGQTTVASLGFQSFIQTGLFQKAIILFRDLAQRRALNQIFAPLCPSGFTLQWVEGGGERQDSVFNGLCAAGMETELVAIHDAARPLISPETILGVMHLARETGAAVAAHPVADTIKKAVPNPENPLHTTLLDLDRRSLWAMETPQAFQFDRIFDAYQRIRQEGISITDDTAALQHHGQPVALYHNPLPNPKITNPSDLAYVEALLRLRHESAC